MRISDWSSDVCSSDLFALDHQQLFVRPHAHDFVGVHEVAGADLGAGRAGMLTTLKNAAMGLGVARRAKFEGFLSHRLGQQFGGRMVVHPERLQHRSEAHPSELQTLMRISYAVF